MVGRQWLSVIVICFQLLMKGGCYREKVFGNNAAGILDKHGENAGILGKHPATLNERLAFDTQNSLPVLLRYADRTNDME